MKSCEICIFWDIEHIFQSGESIRFAECLWPLHGKYPESSMGFDDMLPWEGKNCKCFEKRIPEKTIRRIRYWTQVYRSHLGNRPGDAAWRRFAESRVLDILGDDNG